MLRFEACSLFCRVYVDGAVAGASTLGGFTPFNVTLRPSQAAQRVVHVVASNVFDPVLTPSQAANYDFYQYGGLIREVTLHVLPPTHLDRVAVSPTRERGGLGPSGRVNVSVSLGGRGAAAATAELALCWDIGAAARCTAAPKPYPLAGGTVHIAELPVPGGVVWDPTSSAPALHTLTVALPDDAVQVRFGLRTVVAAGRHILVNGKQTKLHGYNRHDLYPQLGPSLPTSVYDEDLRLLKGPLRGNFIRGSHCAPRANLPPSHRRPLTATRQTRRTLASSIAAMSRGS